MNYARLDITQLRALGKALEVAKSARVKVGILGDKAARFDDDWNKEKINNPSLGAVHEFGSKKRNVPARSFLRMPLTFYLAKKVDLIGRSVWRRIVIEKSVLLALKELGVLAETIVQQAFATGGFGNWAPYSPRYGRWKEMFTRRKTGTVKMIGPVQLALLILSGQLRKAVTSRVVPGKAGT